jgi:formylglycine-generating enzyme required for sulfatase activity
MAGNVWEWSESLWAEDEETRVVRGGAWDYLRGFAACAFRYSEHPHSRSVDIGFRCART